MWESIEATATRFLRVNNNPLGLLLLGASACLEYVFPPFPGDMVTLFGAVLVTQHGWSLPLVFSAVLAGSGVGSMADFAVGRLLRPRYEAGRWPRAVRSRRTLAQILAAFRRHGELYVALNRFLPAVRALFFLAAGMAGLRPGRVLLFSLLSASAWNALILGVGYAVGSNWERIRGLAQAYSAAAWGLLLAAAVVLLLRRRWKRRRAPVPPGAGGPGPGEP